MFDDKETTPGLIPGLILAAALIIGIFIFNARHLEQIQKDVEARNGYLTVDLGQPESIEINSDGSIIQFRIAYVEMHEPCLYLDTSHEYQLLLHRDYPKRNFLYDKQTTKYTRAHDYSVKF